MWNKFKIIAFSMIAVFAICFTACENETKESVVEEVDVEDTDETISEQDTNNVTVDPNSIVTTKQFVCMVLNIGDADPAAVDETLVSKTLDDALSKGIIDDYDLANKGEPIEKRAAARIAHQVLLQEYHETDEADWSSAERLKDLYDCGSCVIHIAQMYAKGIMEPKEEDFFDYLGTLTYQEAKTIVSKMKDKEKRVVPEKLEQAELIELEPEEALQMSDALFVDVRTAEEYSEGHIENSINIPLEELTKNPLMVSDNKDIPIILYCVKGYKSTNASELLIEAGYRKVYVIPGVEQYEYDLVKE